MWFVLLCYLCELVFSVVGFLRFFLVGVLGLWKCSYRMILLLSLWDFGGFSGLWLVLLLIYWFRISWAHERWPCVSIFPSSPTLKVLVDYKLPYHFPGLQMSQSFIANKALLRLPESCRELPCSLLPYRSPVLQLLPSHWHQNPCSMWLEV